MSSNLWSRLRNARLVRVVAVYLAASWLILQVVAFFVDRFGVPPWVMPTTLVLLVVGLLVMLATAWVQAHPATPARAATDEVPHGWELELKDLGQSIARGDMPHLTWARAAFGGAIAFALLFGMAGLYVVIKDRGRSFAPSEAMAEAAAPGIAVLPFQASGPGLDVWREGVIDLVSTNLDGAGGLRAIDSRTVLARWGETVREGAVADLTTSLEAARKTGARYAVLGAAVMLGGQVRLTAEIYDVDRARSLGRTQVEGSPDSVYMLIDRLSIEILRTVLGADPARLPRVDLARTTTSSLPALRAYLEGELLYRKADFPAALEAYRRAVAADTTFALAYKRLSETIGWLPGPARGGQEPPAFSRLALRYADRLSEREAILVRALYAFHQGSVAMLEPLKQAAQRYPDDPEIWFLVQEHYAHFGEQLLLPREELWRAFDKLLTMDPTFAPFYHHPIERAFQEADSARAFDLVGRYQRLVSASQPGAVEYRLALDLAWGTPAARARALAAADTLGADALPVVELRHPRFVALQETLAVKVRDEQPVLYGRAVFQRGRLDAILGDLPHAPPGVRAYLVYTLRDHGAPIEPGVMRSAIHPAMTDSLEWGNFYVAAVAAEEGRWDEHRRIVADARSFADSLRASGDSLFGESVAQTARALEAYATWRRGDRETGLRELVAAQRGATGWSAEVYMNRTIRWWIVRLLLELDRPAEAEPYLLSLPPDSYAYFELGRLYERLGEARKARESYELFVTAWQDADPELQPQVAEARQAIARLGFAPRG